MSNSPLHVRLTGEVDSSGLPVYITNECFQCAQNNNINPSTQRANFEQDLDLLDNDASLFEEEEVDRNRDKRRRDAVAKSKADKGKEESHEPLTIGAWSRTEDEAKAHYN